MSKGFYMNYLKRVVDFIAAFVALLVFLPVMLLVVIMLYVTGHRKVFFTQQRVGKDDNIFTLVKFRSMTEKKDPNGNLLPDEKRLTRFGAMLRKTSLDELPQLYNVLKGDMSLIGPRPLLVQYLPLYSEEQKMRHLVRPGITGMAQVNGRNAISWKKKFEYDVWYVKHASFMVDCKILLTTFKKVLKKEDISPEGFVTPEPFNGHN